ncbi:GL10642 [Drosophila persimilis]|uniref:GL10642 n=1 Tax=Drosophila persimilis TaxID=7234 RepID=B4GAV3_DROPE|nr:GL10642 [Drosophila persimilis]
MRKHCIHWIWLVLVLSRLIHVRAEQQADEHRIQRRFMWQEMNNSVMGSVLGRMFGGARAMKSMFTDLLPSPAVSGHTKKSPATIDLRPTEMTRVKYIIRNPHTHKPMKIIKMRPSAKKVVQLRRPLPKPRPGVATEATTHSLSYDHRMRQLEKEQELIAEGKAPLTSDEDLMDKYFRKKAKGGPGSASNEVVSGKIMEYQSWKPVYKAGEQPSSGSFVTLRPQALTQLHTDISSSGRDHHHDHHDQDHELLPKPEKLVGYESRGTTTSSTTTTTTEAPNYPPSFLKKYREREAAATTRRPRKQHKQQQQQQQIHGGDGGGGASEEDSITTSQPSSSMSSLRARLQEQQRRTKHQHQHQHKQRLEDEEYEAALVEAMHGDKWPAEVHHSGYQLSSPIGPSAVAFEQAVPQPGAAKYPHPKEHKRPPRANIRERGSVKFGDKPSYEDEEAA